MTGNEKKRTLADYIQAMRELDALRGHLRAGFRKAHSLALVRETLLRCSARILERQLYKAGVGHAQLCRALEENGL